MERNILAVIPARAGSKGLPGKNVLSLAGRPMIAYTIEHAKQSKFIDATCVTTDSLQAANIARTALAFVVERPPELGTDTATVDSAVRHAVEGFERVYPKVTHVAILYPNVPLRAPGIIDRAIQHLIDTGADSIRSLTKIDKQHPDWLHRLDGDKLVQYRKNSIYRRQDLEPLYYHDGAVVAVTRESLFIVSPDDNHAFLGKDRRGVVSEGGVTVDVDDRDDFLLAEAILEKRLRETRTPSTPSTKGAAR